MDICSPMENVCRTCMGESCKEKAPKRRKVKSLISIFTEPESHKNNGNTIIDLLRLTTPQLTIETDDLLPKTMCSACVDRLLDSHEFQQMCIRVEQRLRETVIKEDEDDDLKEEPDPLNNNLSQPAFNDLSNVLKVELDELDEPMIDNNEINDKNVVEIYKSEDGDDQYDGGLQSSSDDESSDWDWDDRTKKKKKLDQSEATELDAIDPTSTVTQKEIDEKRKPFACVDCGRRLKTLKSLERHVERLHAGKALNECRYCKKVFEKKTWLRNHLRTHKENRIDKDETKDSSESHIDDKTDTNNQTKSEEDHTDGLCTETNKTAENHIEDNQEKDSVSKDRKVKQKKKQFFCLQCGYGLKSGDSWKRHIDKVHSGVVPQAKTYNCRHCGKVFSDHTTLREHYKEHVGGEKTALCPECGKSFATLGIMKQHLLRHGTARPYECPHCPLRYPTLSSLASHKLMHSTVKPHVCDVCGKAFTSRYTLKTHKKYHTGEKNFKCDYCEMKFVLGSQCQTHMRTHTGEKPFQCKYCSSCFKQGNALRKHLRMHLGINVYRCSMCPQAFRLNSILRDHLISHKNEDEETRAKNLQALKNDELLLQFKCGFASKTGEEQE